MKVSQTVLDQICKDYVEGISSTKLAKQYHLSHTTVRKYLRDAGITVREQHARKFLKKVRRAIAFAYRNGESSIVLAKRYNTSSETVLLCVREFGFEIRSCGKVLTPMMEVEISKQYRAGKSGLSIAKALGIGSSAVYGCLHHLGIDVNNSGKAYEQRHQRHYNRAFFATWSPDMAYVLGFAFADGSVSRKDLHFYQKDRYILDKIAETFGYDGPVTPNSARVHVLALSSIEIVHDLAELGLYPNNSHTMTVPEIVPYPQDFVRGYFDGDGHGGWYKKRQARVLRIGFSSSSRAFLVGIQRLSPIEIGGPYPTKRGGWALMTSRLETGIALRDWLYSGQSSLCIPRKKEKLFPSLLLPV